MTARSPGCEATTRDAAAREAALWIAAAALHLAWWAGLLTGAMRPLFNDTMHRAGRACDFFAVYQAGHCALHGASIYQPHALSWRVPYFYPYRYFPFGAYSLGAVLNALPPWSAYIGWVVLCEICLLVHVRLTYTCSGGGSRGAFLALIWLAFAPYFLELWVGQFTFILGSLLFWCVLCAESRRQRCAEILWIASVLFKPASLLWSPIWWSRKGSRLVVGIVFALLLADLTYFAAFPSDWELFAHENLSPLPTWHAGNIGLSALLYQLSGGGGSYETLRLGVTAALVAPALWVTLAPSRTRPRPLWLLAALWTTLFFLVYKDVWEHHLTLLLPFLVLGLWRLPSRQLAGLTALLALPSPFLWYDQPGPDPQATLLPAISILHHSWRVAPLLLVYSYWLVHLARASGTDGKQATDSEVGVAPA